MPKYIVDGSDLTSVANTIRTKGGTSESLSFPSGFVSAIGNLGGSSDFSTAEVVVTNNNSNFVTILIPNIVEGEDAGITNAGYPEGSSPLTLKVPVYKGFCFCLNPFSVVGPPVTVTVTGDITWNSETTVLKITGDGTITLS